MERERGTLLVLDDEGSLRSLAHGGRDRVGRRLWVLLRW